MKKLRGQGIVGLLVGGMIALILLTAVVMPVVRDVVSDQAYTGTTKTITDLFPLLLAVVGLMVIVGLIQMRG